jgi:predicted site-specific integrase-resolvase
MNTTTDKLLSPDQLGEIYQVSGRTIRRWHDEGRFPAEVDEGKVLRFDPDQVAAVLKNRARKAAKAKASPSLA